VINLNQLEMGYAGKVLFSDVSLQFHPGNRYGLSGSNGSGKTTLLRVISGQERPTSGSLEIPSSLKIGVLEQDHFTYESEAIINVVLSGRVALWDALKEKDRLLAFGSDEELEHLASIEEEIERHGGYGAEGEAASILAGLGIPAFRLEQSLSVLSGGFKLRVLLARMLFSQPDIMLLDEPTNHLDLYSIQWLEDYLVRQDCMMILVSHDVRFLNAVCTHIADIDYGKIQIYPGNYHDALKQKQEIVELQEKTNRRLEKKKSDLEAFVDRFRAKATKARQAQSRVKMLEKLDVPVHMTSSRRNPAIHFEQCRQAGSTVLEVKGLSKSYGDNKVLSNVTFEVSRGEKIAILGPNGIGKSTLIKILCDSLSHDSGEVHWGYETHYQYFPQDSREILGEKDVTAYDWLQSQDPSAPISKIRGLLGCMLFSGDDALKKISILSGGECSRLVIGRLMLLEHNILLLDEPTNHLDIEGVEELINALDSYEGTVLFVSHNREMVSRVAQRILEITPDYIRQFPGGYDEFIATVGNDWLQVQKKKSQVSSDATESQLSREESKTLQRELKKMRRDIELLEEKLETLEAENENLGSLFSDVEQWMKLSPEVQKEKVLKKEELDTEIASVMEQWELLSFEAEETAARLS
jgi:ATPase subunit of ABC transporter with duplicated ATPase domains